MFLPGLPSPSPEIVGALLSGEKPTPFDALADGLDLWERRFGMFSEVAAYIGTERLGVPPAVSGLMPGGTDAGGVNELEMLPQWQRVVLAAEELPALWEGARKAVWVAADREGSSGWSVALEHSAGVTDRIRHAFGLVGRGDMDVLRRHLSFLNQGLCRWAWVVGLLAQQDRPLVPNRVLEALTAEGQGDPGEVFEALVVLRLLQGKASMAGYVIRRWLTELIWGDLGLSGDMPLIYGPLMAEMSWALQRRSEVLEAAPFLSEQQKTDLEALRWDSSRPDGMASGVAVLWDRIDRFSAGSQDAAKAFRDAVAKPLSDDSDPYGEIADGDAVAVSTVRHQWLCRQADTRDFNGRLERVLLPVVDAELATSAALFVLRWRHHMISNRIWREPAGFAGEFQHWLASVLVRWDGGVVDVEPVNVSIINNHLLSPARGVFAKSYRGRLTAEQENDWRVTEFLRPLVFAALSSMAIGLKAGHATQLQEVEWVREAVWNPNLPAIRVDQVFAQLLMLCSHEKCTVPQLRALPERLARQMGVDAEHIEQWLECQPFELTDLEEFRQRVIQRKTEALTVGGLVETLNARAHFKPSWLTGPLTGLAMPRPHGVI